MSHLFLSHVEEDAPLALELAAGLEAAGYRTWYYERDSVPGASYLSQVPRAIEGSLLVVLLLSPATLGSWQVDKEIVQGHEAGRAFLPLLRGVSHGELRAGRPDWAMALGAATSLSLTGDDVPRSLPRLLEGLHALGVYPDTTAPVSPFRRAAPRPQRPRVPGWGAGWRALLRHRLLLATGVLAGVAAAALAVTAAHHHTVTPADPVSRACCGALFVRLTSAGTGHNLRGPFLHFYKQYGGETIFGRPRTEQFQENGQWVQYTDRFRLELTGGKVVTTPLGRLLTAGRAFPRVGPPPSSASQMYFRSTGHLLSEHFLAYWQGHHGAILLGAPISEVEPEKNGDGTGNTYEVQWCEKGRLEWHPDQMLTRNQVMLGLLGKQALQQRGWLPPD